MMRAARKTNLLLLLAIAITCLPANSHSQAQPHEDYFPLTKGMKWKYQLFNKVRNTTEVLELTVKGERFLKELGKNIVVIDERFSGIDSPTGYSRDGEGYVLRHLSLAYDEKGDLHAAHEITGIQKILPARLEVGKAWEDSSRVLFNRVYNKNRIVSKENVRVKAGEFSDCYLIITETLQEVEYAGASTPHQFRFVYRDWYAPNVGLIRSIVENPQLRQIITEIELIEYSREREKL